MEVTAGLLGWLMLRDYSLTSYISNCCFGTMLLLTKLVSYCCLKFWNSSEFHVHWWDLCKFCQSHSLLMKGNRKSRKPCWGNQAPCCDSVVLSTSAERSAWCLWAGGETCEASGERRRTEVGGGRELIHTLISSIMTGNGKYAWFLLHYAKPATMYSHMHLEISLAASEGNSAMPKVVDVGVELFISLVSFH